MVNIKLCLKWALEKTNDFFDDKSNRIFDSHCRNKDGTIGKDFTASNYQFNKYPNNVRMTSSFHNSIFNSLLRFKIEQEDKNETTDKK